ncbi:hypothetical protein FB45DRAFT_1030469 [Roridomyces roridus]|uniref:BTB domain-containing protein n=1 Tax=Roridomyces roridus TaxID=1738132 RepID=A0AAD7BPE6_9AGAR|nr:hypothetical protein FB45DRAFT_1030469 [Roridomyces roridus]
MAIRVVGTGAAPAGVSPADFAAHVSALAEKTLALPIAASTITKYNLLIPNHDLSAKVANLGLPAPPNTIITEVEFESEEKLLAFAADPAFQAMVAESKAKGNGAFLFAVDTVVKNRGFPPSSSSTAPPSDTAMDEQETSTNTFTRVADLWFSDGSLIIRAEDREFYVSGAVLAARSSVFSDMLSIPQAASNSNSMSIVVLPDKSGEVESFLRAVFDSKCVTSLMSRELSPTDLHTASCKSIRSLFKQWALQW